MVAMCTYLLLLLWQPVLSSDLCQDHGGASCDAIGGLEAALKEDVSEETLKLLQTKQVPGIIDPGQAVPIIGIPTEDLDPQPIIPAGIAEDPALGPTVSNEVGQIIQDQAEDSWMTSTSFWNSGGDSYNTWDDPQLDPHYEHHDDRHEYDHHYDDHHYDDHHYDDHHYDDHRHHHDDRYDHH